jgi:hypothetical protein
VQLTGSGKTISVSQKFKLPSSTLLFGQAIFSNQGTMVSFTDLSTNGNVICTSGATYTGNGDSGDIINVSWCDGKNYKMKKGEYEVTATFLDKYAEEARADFIAYVLQ